MNGSIETEQLPKIEQLKAQREQLTSDYQQAAKEYWLAVNKHENYFSRMDILSIVRGMFPGQIKEQKTQLKQDLDSATKKKHHLETQIHAYNSEVRNHSNAVLATEQEVTKTKRVKPKDKGVSFGLMAHTERVQGNFVEADMLDMVHEALESTTEHYTEQVTVEPSEQEATAYEQEQGIAQIRMIEISQQALSDLIESRAVEVGEHFTTEQFNQAIQATLEKIDHVSNSYETDTPEHAVLEKAKQRLNKLNTTIKNRLFPDMENLSPKSTIAVFAVAVLASLAVYSLSNNYVDNSSQYLGQIQRFHSDNIAEIQRVSELITETQIIHTILQAGVLAMATISLTVEQNRRVAASIINQIQSTIQDIESNNNE